MTTHGEAQPYGFDYELSSAEVTKLRDELVWPAINFLARKDFVKHAHPGSVFSHDLTTVHDDTITRAGVSAVIETVWDDDVVSIDDQERVCSVTLTTEVIRSEMTEALIGLAKDCRNTDEELPGEAQMLLHAWEITEYSFDNTAEPPERRTHFELQDNEKNVFWTDESMEGDEEERESDDDHESWEMMEEDVSLGLNTGDIKAIRAAFTELGVPLPD